jgi:hypothetical protein
VCITASALTESRAPERATIGTSSRNPVIDQRLQLEAADRDFQEVLDDHTDMLRAAARLDRLEPQRQVSRQGDRPPRPNTAAAGRSSSARSAAAASRAASTAPSCQASSRADTATPVEEVPAANDEPLVLGRVERNAAPIDHWHQPILHAGYNDDWSTVHELVMYLHIAQAGEMMGSGENQ